MTTEGGYIKLFRKLKDNPIFRDSTKLHLWVYCLVNASHTGHKTILGRREVFLQPGQFITGRHRAAMETGLTEKQVRAGLKALERLDMVKLKTSQGQAGTIVTVCNWEHYQNANEYEGQERARAGPSEGQVGATTEEWLKGKELKEKLSPRAREGSACQRMESSMGHADEILDEWRQARERVGMKFARDGNTKRGAEDLAEMLAAGDADMDGIRTAMRHALESEIGGSYSLAGVARNYAALQTPERKRGTAHIQIAEDRGHTRGNEDGVF